MTSWVDAGDDFGHNIPTCADYLFNNQQLDESINLSPHIFIKAGYLHCSNDIFQLQDIDVSTRKKCLLNSKSQEFTSTSLSHCKLSRAYQHLDANHTCNVSFNGLKQSYNFYVIKASCIPSQSGDETKIKHLHVIRHKRTGEPYGGFCKCTVGLVYYWKKQICLEKF